MALATETGLAELDACSVEDLIPLQPDHVAARLYTLSPGACMTGPDPAGSAGQFHVVVTGALVTAAG